MIKYYIIKIKSTGKYISKHWIAAKHSDKLDYYYVSKGDKDPIQYGVHSSWRDKLDYTPDELEIMEIPFSDCIPQDMYLHSIGDYLYNLLDEFESKFGLRLKAVDLQVSQVTECISLTIHTQGVRAAKKCIKLAEYIYNLLKDNKLLSDKYKIKYVLTGSRDKYPLDIYSISDTGEFKRLDNSNSWYH